MALMEGPCRYASLESQHLRADLDSAELPSGAGEGLAEGLQQLVPLAFQLCMAVIDRSLRLTQGTELPSVIPVLDSALQQFLVQIKV